MSKMRAFSIVPVPLELRMRHKKHYVASTPKIPTTTIFLPALLLVLTIRAKRDEEKRKGRVDLAA
jgi:hypothetical protein